MHNEKATIGITNLGNTCGINTWLQTIFATPTAVNTITGSSFATNSFGRCVQEIVSLWKFTTGSRRISPSRLVNAIYDNCNGMFLPKEPLDVGELWTWSVQKLHEDSASTWDIDNIVYTDPVNKRIAEITHKFQEGKTSQLLNIFRGLQMTLVKCTSCGHVPLNVEPFTTVQLEIPVTDKSLTLSDLFGHMFRKETMNEWSCDKCQKKHADKTSRFWSLPKVLVVVLKRFTVYPNGSIRKVHTNIDIPENITFHKGSVLSETSDIHYQLRSICLHHGTYDGGHYTSVVQHKGKWYHCDDEEVRELQDVADITKQNRSSYVVVYERPNFN